MKKVIVAALMVLALFALSGCAKTGTCSACGKEDVKVKKVKVDGNEGEVCEDCEKLVKAVQEMSKALEK